MKRSRRRGPAANLRDERRRLARIDTEVLTYEAEVEGVSALPHPLAPLVLGTAAPALALREEARQAQGEDRRPRPPRPRPIVLLAIRRGVRAPALPPPPST